MALRTNGKVTIKVIHAGVGETRFRGEDLPVLRGTLLPEYFYDLEVPGYQRDLLKDQQKHEQLKAALDPEHGMGVPDDMMLCVRSGSKVLPEGAGVVKVV